MLVTPEMLQTAASEAQPEQTPKSDQNTAASGNGTGKRAHKGSFDVREYLEKHGLEIVKEKPHDGGTLYVFSQCPFNADHTSGESAVFRNSKGVLHFQCFHNGCRGRTWHDLREVLGDVKKPKPRQDDGTTDQDLPHALDLFEPADWTAARFLDGPLEELDFVFENSLPTRNVAAIAGPQGAGKGHFILHGCMAVASGEKAFLPIWSVPKPRKVLVLAAEDDSRTLQRRCRHIADAADLSGNLSLHPDRVSQLLRQNLHIFPLTGSDLKLIANDHGNAVASPIFDKLRAAVGRIPDLGLIVLDPLSRWHGGDENNNNVGTTLISLLERLKDETGATILIVHHVNKRAGYPGGKFSLDAALHMDAMRGASAISGGIRWQMNLTPLPAEFAKKELGVPAKEGQFLACRVSKKNHGAPEDVVYLERGQHGTLQVVDRSQTQAEIDVEAEILAWLKKRIAHQEENGLPLLTAKSASELTQEWKDIQGASKARVKSVAEAAVLNGELFTVQHRNSMGRWTDYLSLTPATPDGEGQFHSGKNTGQNTGQKNTGYTGQDTGQCKTHEISDTSTPARKTPATPAKTSGQCVSMRNNSTGHTGHTGPPYGGRREGRKTAPLSRSPVGLEAPENENPTPEGEESKPRWVEGTI